MIVNARGKRNSCRFDVTNHAGVRLHNAQGDDMKLLLQDLELFLEKLHDKSPSAAERLTIDIHLNRVRDELAGMGG